MAQIPVLKITNRIDFKENGMMFTVIVYVNCLYRGALYTRLSPNIHGELVADKPDFISKLYATEYDSLIALKKYVKHYLKESL